jgi:uncharacterized protein YecE (DUF72 family)
MVRIGTSGYSFKDWVGTFYPAGVAERDMLPFYATRFDTVEVNFTYYRLPTARTMAGMAARTPPGFTFFVKAFEAFTHKQDLSDKAAFLDGVAPLQEAGKFAGLLFQFPQSFKNEAENRRYLAQLAAEFAGCDCAVEFRDRSWAAPPVCRFLEDQRLSIVAVDEPAISTLFPRDAVVSGDVGYVRFHSRDGAKWYKGMAERYDYSYTEPELKEWVPKIETIAKKAKRLYAFFNNCHQGQAAANAEALKHILRQAGLAGAAPAPVPP